MRIFSLLITLSLALPLLGDGQVVEGIRGAFVDVMDNPWQRGLDAEGSSMRFFRDGLMVINEGKIVELDDYERIKHKYPNIRPTEYPGKLITPGFVDLHSHYFLALDQKPQGKEYESIFSEHVFPAMRRLQDGKWMQKVAKAFVHQKLSSGVTTCLTMSSTTKESVKAVFDIALERHLRLYTGLMGVDREMPEQLLISPDAFYKQSLELMDEYAEKDRVGYVISPYSSQTASVTLLEMCDKLKRVYRDKHAKRPRMQMLLGQSPRSVIDFPKRFSSLQTPPSNVIELLTQHTLLDSAFIGLEGIYLSAEELSALFEAGATLAFCPLGNLQNGMGLFPVGLMQSAAHPLVFGLGTNAFGGGTTPLESICSAMDVGALNMLSYSVPTKENLASIPPTAIHFEVKDALQARLFREQSRITHVRSFYLATLAGAKALGLEEHLGNFTKGKQADFVVWDAPSDAALLLDEGKIERVLEQLLSRKSFEVLDTYVSGTIAYSKHGMSRKPQPQLERDARQPTRREMWRRRGAVKAKSAQ